MLLFRTNEVLFAYYGIYYYCIILWKPDFVVPSLSMEIAMCTLLPVSLDCTLLITSSVVLDIQIVTNNFSTNADFLTKHSSILFILDKSVTCSEQSMDHSIPG
jgi:hypothetical protein